MNYQDYKDARDASWRILIDCEVTELPIRISGVCRALGVSVRRYTPAERDSNDGMSTVIGGARRSWCPAWRSRRGSALPAHTNWGTSSSVTSAGMISCAASQIRVTTPSSRRPTCLPRVCLPRPVCSGAAAFSRPRTSSGCATSAERLPNSVGRACRSFTGGSAF